MSKFKSKSYEENIIEGAFIVGFVFLIFLISVPLFTGGSVPIDDQTKTKYLFYAIPAIVSGVFILIIKAIHPIIEKKENFKKFGWLQSFDFYDSEKASDLWKNAVRFENSRIKVFLVFATIVSLLFLISGVFNTFFTSYPEFQVEFISSLWFSVEPAGAGEVLPSMILLGLFWGLGYRLSNRKKDKFIYFLFLFLGLATNVGYWIFEHTLRYGSENTKLLGVGVFATVGTLLVYLTGSIIPFWLWKDGNNLFQKLSSVFSSDTYTLITFVIFMSLLITTIIVFLRKKGKPNKQGKIGMTGILTAIGIIAVLGLGVFLIPQLSSIGNIRVYPVYDTSTGRISFTGCEQGGANPNEVITFGVDGTVSIPVSIPSFDRNAWKDRSIATNKECIYSQCSDSDLSDWCTIYNGYYFNERCIDVMEKRYYDNYGNDYCSQFGISYKPRDGVCSEPLGNFADWYVHPDSEFSTFDPVSQESIFLHSILWDGTDVGGTMPADRSVPASSSFCINMILTEEKPVDTDNDGVFDVNDECPATPEDETKINQEGCSERQVCDSVDCDDGNRCTIDYCSWGRCLYDDIAGCCRFDNDCGDGEECIDDVCVSPEPDEATPPAGETPPEDTPSATGEDATQGSATQGQAPQQDSSVTPFDDTSSDDVASPEKKVPLAFFVISGIILLAVIGLAIGLSVKPKKKRR